MHVAPPVRMNLAPDRAWHVAVSVCAAATGACLAAWGALQAQSPTPTVVAASLAAAAGASLLALWRIRRSASTGLLAWDGGGWHWSPDAMARYSVEPRVMIDLGPWLLLRIAPTVPARRAVWAVASRRLGSASWPQWRATLYARIPGDEPAPANDPK
jgi:hypothetical protein